MASEYLKWKYRDVKPDPPPRPLTGKEKWKNWWDYHKWHVVIALVLLAALGNILGHALGIGKTEPDCQIAYVGSAALPTDTAAALEKELAALCGDLNGDGQAMVTIRQYVSSSSGEDADSVYYAYAAEVALTADLESCGSSIFILEDPEAFQRSYHALCLPDGSLPANDSSAEGTSLPWNACPVLRLLPLGGYEERSLGGTIRGDSQERLSGLYIARRGYWTEKTVKNADGCAALWEAIIEGASA